MLYYATARSEPSPPLMQRQLTGWEMTYAPVFTKLQNVKAYGGVVVKIHAF